MAIDKDTINHPTHYTSHPSGIECIQITEHFNFNIGNVIKYVWRAGLKNSILENLLKAQWYLAREIERIEKGIIKTMNSSNDVSTTSKEYARGPIEDAKPNQAGIYSMHCESCLAPNKITCGCTKQDYFKDALLIAKNTIPPRLYDDDR